MRSLLHTLAALSSRRVNHYGAEYTAFGIIGIINFIIPYLMWFHFYDPNNILLYVRSIGTILCFLLIVHPLWTPSMRRYLPLYWHATLLYCLGFQTTFTLLHNTSIHWLLNALLALLMLVMLVDWISFVTILAMGIALGWIIFVWQYGMPSVPLEPDVIQLILYMYGYTILIGGIFSRSKDKFQQQIIRLQMIADEERKKVKSINSTLEDKIEERTAHLKEALSIRTEFLNNLSHEVRTPIQGVTAIASGLVSEWDKLSEDRRKQYARDVANNANRLFALVNDILDVSKFKSGKSVITLQPCDLIDITYQALLEYEPIAREKSLSISLTVNRLPYDPSMHHSIYADAVKLSRVYRNLLSNAISVTDTGRIEIAIEILENNIIIAVCDEGVGIKPGEEQEIFNPFRQGSLTAKNTGGTGLGLSICREIIHAHHGVIYAENRPTRGACFTIILPDRKVSTSRDPLVIQAPAKETDASTAITKPLHILVVDDEPACLTSLELMLASQPITLHQTQTAKEFFDMLHTNGTFDLILLDIMLPDMMIEDILKALQRHYKHIPVILQTGIADQASLDLLCRKGAKAYLIKPYRGTELVQTIQKAIARE